MVSDSQLSYGCSSAWGTGICWVLWSLVWKKGKVPFIDTVLYHQSANSCAQLWESLSPKRGPRLNPRPLFWGQEGPGVEAVSFPGQAVCCKPVLAVHLHLTQGCRPPCEPGSQPEHSCTQLAGRASNPLQVSSSPDLEKTKVMNLLKAGCWFSCCTSTMSGHRLEEPGVKARNCWMNKSA